MPDYRVIYVEATGGEDRELISVRIERQCNLSSAEGWLLYETIPDVESGTTRGVWLVFEVEDDDDDDDVREPGAVAEAEQILDQAGS
jgi:hypothetical protein